MRKIYFPMLTLSLMILMTACVTTLQSYEPKNPEEDAIKALLMKWESTWNKRDVEGHLRLWNNNAEIMYGRDRKIATKKEYVTILPERMKAVPSIKLEAPKIRFSGDKADVNLNMAAGNYKTPVTYHLVKENNNWSIMTWDY